MRPTGFGFTLRSQWNAGPRAHNLMKRINPIPVGSYLKLRASVVRIETARLALLTFREKKDERDNPHGQHEGSNDLDESNEASFHKIHATIRIAAMEARRYITLRAECSRISAAFSQGHDGCARQKGK